MKRSFLEKSCTVEIVIFVEIVDKITKSTIFTKSTDNDMGVILDYFEYERRKRQLPFDLTAEEYQDAIKRICRELEGGDRDGKITTAKRTQGGA